MIQNKSVATAEESENCSIIQSTFKELIFTLVSEVGKEMLVGYTMNHCLMEWKGRGFVVRLVVAVSVMGMEGV